MNCIDLFSALVRSSPGPSVRNFFSIQKFSIQWVLFIKTSFWRTFYLNNLPNEHWTADSVRYAHQQKDSFNCIAIIGLDIINLIRSSRTFSWMESFNVPRHHTLPSSLHFIFSLKILFIEDSLWPIASSECLLIAVLSKHYLNTTQHTRFKHLQAQWFR